MDTKLIINTNQLYIGENKTDFIFGKLKKEKLLTSKNSFSLKVEKKLDVFLSSFYKLPKIDEEVAECIFDCVEFLKNQKIKNINELIIKVNLKSPINQFKTKKMNIFGLMDYDNDLYLINAIPYDSIMNLGTNAFNEEKDIPEETKTLLKNVGRRDAIEFVFFHEFAHSLDVALIKKDNNNSFLKSIHNLKFNDYSKKDFKKEFENEFELNVMWAKHISILSGEIYADIISILMKRNKNIEERKSESDLYFFIEEIKNWREFHRGEIPLSRHCEEDYIEKISHFTLIGINLLCEKLNGLKGKMSEDEMSLLAREIQEESICKVIYSQIKAKPELMAQLIQISENKKLNPKNILKSYRYIRNVCKNSWINQFNEKVKLIGSNKELKEHKSFHVFDIGTNPQNFEKNIYLKIDKKIKY